MRLASCGSVIPWNTLNFMISLYYVETSESIEIHNEISLLYNALCILTLLIINKII